MNLDDYLMWIWSGSYRSGRSRWDEFWVEMYLLNSFCCLKTKDELCFEDWEVTHKIVHFSTLGKKRLITGYPGAMHEVVG